MILDNIDIDLAFGEAIGITGANGSGKTTLGMILSGFMKPDSGKVRHPAGSIRSSLLLEDPSSQFLCGTVKDEIYFPGRNFNIGPDFIDGLMHSLNLKNLEFKSPFHLSFGQQERTVIGAILSGNPDIIILDEPTQGLDAAGKNLIIKLILALKRAQKSVAVISHDLDFLQSTTDRIFRLEQGKLRVSQ